MMRATAAARVQGCPRRARLMPDDEGSVAVGKRNRPGRRLKRRCPDDQLAWEGGCERAIPPDLTGKLPGVPIRGVAA